MQAVVHRLDEGSHSIDNKYAGQSARRTRMPRRITAVEINGSAMRGTKALE
jgi:hypothetical protein